MKTKLAQLVMLASRIDRQYIQLAYFAFAVLGMVFAQSPSDTGTGPR